MKNLKLQLTPTKCSHPDCNACARDFFKWVKTRMAQMDVDLKDGNSTTFAEAAATSVKPPRLSPGDSVKVSSLDYRHTAKVVHNAGSVGLDGRHWVEVEVFAHGETKAWHVHVEAGSLEVP